MKLVLAFLLFFFSFVYIEAQISNVQEEFALPVSVSESSGAIMFNGVLVTHNDSGGQNELYELDLGTETIIRTITITNATNVDYEDLAQDDTHIYLGDFGNNSGSRTDLKIYKILKSDFTNSTSVTAEVINFDYQNQSDFTSNPQNTVWDAEALISFNANELLIISKNWVDGISNVYVISKTAGTYSLSPQSTTLNTGGLITGATFNELSGKIYLCGYTEVLQPFVWACESFSGSDIFSGSNTQRMLTELSLEQIEGIAHTSVNEYFVVSESFSVTGGGITFSDYANLISFSTSDVTLSISEKNEQNVTLYPNPVLDKLHIEVENLSSLEIFNMQSVLLYSGSNLEINLSSFSSGLYVVKVNFKDDTSVIKRIMKH
jgi:hypothetical protein